MAYIGKTPVIGNFQKCDSISVVNGQAAYTLQVGGVNVSPQSENHMLVSLNGILQAPVDSFTVSGSTLTFASNLVTGDVIDFVMILGNVLDLGVPSDNTVTTAKIVDGAITSAKLASGTGGKVLQVVSATDSTTRNTTSSSFVTASNTLSVNITPSSTSNKIFIIVNAGGYINNTGDANYTIYRDSTNLGGSNGMTTMYNDTSAQINGSIAMSYLDSPSSTSELTYQVYLKANAGTVYINYPNGKASITAFEIAG
jgi:hypothetical protein